MTSAASVPVTLGAITDAGAGTTAGGTRVLQRSTAPLVGNACGTFTAFADLIINPTVAPGVQTTPLLATRCNMFRYVFTDNVTNQSITTSPSIVRATTYAAVIGATPGLQSHWRMADTGTVIDDTRAANNDGTYFGAPIRGAAGAIARDTNTSVTFDGVDDYGQVARQISGDYSIELWFRSTQGRGTSNNWYDGAGLVDGEVANVANDFGISLMADGRVATGTGNPDVSALSPAGFNDGAWHHVVVTRTQATGAVRLYVDGVLRATVTGGVQALTGPATLSFGRINTGVNYFAGSLDEIATYISVLTPAQIANHNQSGR